MITDEKRTSERRAHSRVTALLRIEYSDREDFLFDYLTDLSEGGLFVRTRVPLEVGEEVDFSISFPGLLDPIPLRGIVRRCMKDEEGQTGLGIEFIFQDEQTRIRIKRLVDQIESKQSKDQKESIPFRILVVDDNKLVLELFSHALQRLGQDRGPGGKTPHIVTASNGREAWEIVNNQEIDMVILDNYMPIMDGITFLRLVRSVEKFSNLTVVMISVDEEHLKLSSLKSGADLYIAKPVQAKTLLSTLSALLED